MRLFSHLVLACALANLPITSVVGDDRALHPEVQKLSEDLKSQHHSLHHSLSPEEFEERLQRLNDKWTGLDKKAATFEVSRLLAGLRDGHTFVPQMLPPISVEFSLLPVEFYLFSEGLYIRAAHKSVGEIAGAKVSRIGNVSAMNAIAEVSALVSHDNEMTRLARAPYYLTSLDILHHLKITESANAVSLTLEKDGKEFEVTLFPGKAEAPQIPYGLVERTDWVDANPRPLQDRALWQRTSERLIWHHYDPALKLFYLQYNEFEEPEDQTLEDYLSNLTSEMASLEIEKFVLDLRRNRGGETPLVLPLAKWLMAHPQVNRENRFFVVTGRRTFSAAQLLINVLHQYSHAIFVGEPTGASPHFYANSRPRVQIDRLGLTVLTPTKYWQTTDEDDARVWQAPHLATDISFTDYIANQDPALKAIEEFQSLPDLEALMAEPLLGDPANGLPKALAIYEAYKANPLYRFNDTEALINRIGYGLLSMDRVDDAIAIFKLNTRDYPLSANTHDSLGEAYMVKGDKARALKNYSKVLAIDPQNTHAKEQIRILNED